MINKNIVFFGGDKRQLFAASALSEVYREVRLLGFDMLISEGRLIIDNDVGCLGNADLVVMPIVGVKNGTVQTLFSDNEYKLDGETLPLLKDKLIAAGKGESFESFGLRVYDLLRREDFTLKNAYLTAEGAVSVAMDSYEGSIANAKILVIGYGRIGKYLSRMLRALGASVTVSSRSSKGTEPSGSRSGVTDRSVFRAQELFSRSRQVFMAMRISHVFSSCLIDCLRPFPV